MGQEAMRADDLPPARVFNLSLGTLAGVLLLDALSYSLILPLLPSILETFQAGAIAGGMLVAIHALFAAISGPLLGVLSDRIGRKEVIAGTVFGLMVSYVIFGLSQSLMMLFVARALSGVMAGNIGVIQAAAADHSPAESRAKVIGILNAALAMGFVLGPVVSTLVGRSGAQAALWPGITAALASAVALIMVVVFFREAPNGQEGAETSVSGPKASVLLKQKGVLELIGLMAITAMAQTGLVSMTGFWAVYAFEWGPREIGLLFFWVSAFMVLAQVVAVPQLAKFAGERPSLVISLVVCLCALMGLILAPRSVVVLLCAAPLLFCGITIVQTMCTSLLSQQVNSDQQGTLLGVSTGVVAGARVVGPAIFGLLFAHVAPAAPYWAVAVGVGALVIWFGRHVRFRPVVAN